MRCMCNTMQIQTTGHLCKSNFILAAHLRSESLKHSLTISMRIDPCNCSSIQYHAYTVWILNFTTTVFQPQHNKWDHMFLSKPGLFILTSDQIQNTHRAFFVCLAGDNISFVCRRIYSIVGCKIQERKKSMNRLPKPFLSYVQFTLILFR